MTDTVLVAIIGLIGTLIGALGGALGSGIIEAKKTKNERKLHISKAKFDREFAIYQELSSKNITMVYDMGEAVLIARGMLKNNLAEIDSFLERAVTNLYDAELANKKYAPFISKSIFEKYKKLEKYGSRIITLLKAWKDYIARPQSSFKTGDLEITSQKQATQEIENLQKQLSALSDEILDDVRGYLTEYRFAGGKR